MKDESLYLNISRVLTFENNTYKVWFGKNLQKLQHPTLEETGKIVDCGGEDENGQTHEQ